MNTVPGPDLHALNMIASLRPNESGGQHSQFRDGGTVTQRDSINLPVLTQLAKWVSQVLNSCSLTPEPMS